jgi:hypothetical protein
MQRAFDNSFPRNDDADVEEREARNVMGLKLFQTRLCFISSQVAAVTKLFLEKRR